VRYTLKYIRNLISGSGIAKVLTENDIPVRRLQVNINSVESLNLIRSFNPDLIISIAANQVFKRPLIELPPKGVINLHTALLPKYRGLMPTFWVLKNGETQTGVSVFFVDEVIDSGPIIVQKHFDIDDMTQEELIIATKRLGMDAIIESIDKIQKGGYQLIPNHADDATYYSFPTREDVLTFLKVGKRFF
jgi:methionyl-tRNA formyltransferase